MTPEELDAIEARYRQRQTKRGEAVLAAYGALDDDIPTLIAEVRRLQGLIKRVEWSGGTNEWNNEPTCNWCGADMQDGHRATCPAFPASDTPGKA